jgi:hypothetical protein
LNKQLKGNLLSLSPYILSHFSFFWGRAEAVEERFSLALLQCKGSPAPVDLLWCWGGAITLHMCNINFNPCTPEGAPV